MKKLMKKAGYISIELIIVAGIVLLIGVVAVGKFATSGSTASNKANAAIDNVFTTQGVK